MGTRHVQSGRKSNLRVYLCKICRDDSHRLSHCWANFSREEVEIRKAAADVAERTYRTRKPNLLHNEQQMHLYLVSVKADRAIKRRQVASLVLPEETSSSSEDGDVVSEDESLVLYQAANSHEG